MRQYKSFFPDNFLASYLNNLEAMQKFASQDIPEPKKGSSKSDKIKEAAKLLSDACEIIQDIPGGNKVCKKINKALDKLGKLAESDDNFVAQINSAEDVEKSIQEDLDK